MKKDEKVKALTADNELSKIEQENKDETIEELKQKLADKDSKIKELNR